MICAESVLKITRDAFLFGYLQYRLMVAIDGHMH